MANRNPSPHTRFKAGAEWAGNAKGRPPGRSLTAKLREMLDASTLDGRPIADGKTLADLLAETILRGALGGDIRFLKEILDRTEGKVTGPVDEPAEDQETARRWERFDKSLALVYGAKATAIQEEVERN